MTICTTRNHFNEELKEKLDKVEPDEVTRVGKTWVFNAKLKYFIGGAGNKILHVIQGKSDVSFYPKPGNEDKI